MAKIHICVLFGGNSPEHEVSCRSAQSVLRNLNRNRYTVYPVGITKENQWILYGSEDYSHLTDKTWMQLPENKTAFISPIRGEGLLICENDRISRVKLDAVFPVLHGENGEDGAIQGLLRIAGVPFVGPDICASACSMDKCMTKLVAEHAGVRQAAWHLVTQSDWAYHPESVLDSVESVFSFPVFVKPAGTGSSVGVSKAGSRDALATAIVAALQFDRKVLVEEFIDGREVEVGVLGNSNLLTSVCGEIDAGAEFYDYDTKYVTNTSKLYIPARISDAESDEVRRTAVRIYQALGCRGLSRVDFFVQQDGSVVFNEINTIPGFTSISMYPKLFEAAGIPYEVLLDRLIDLAMEA